MPHFTPSVQDWGVGPKSQKFIQMSEYKRTAWAYALGNFYKIFRSIWSFIRCQNLVRSLKRFQSYEGLNLDNAFCPKFSVPSNSDTMHQTQKRFAGIGMVRISSITMPSWVELEIRTPLGGGVIKLFVFCLSVTLSRDKVCECHFANNVLEYGNNLGQGMVHGCAFTFNFVSTTLGGATAEWRSLRKSSAIAERPMRCSVSVAMLFYCCTKNTNRSHVSLRSTFSNCHVLFCYLHSYVHASLHWAQRPCNAVCHLQTSTTNLDDVNWTTTVINQHGLPSVLLMTPRITPPAYRSERVPPWWMDTNLWW